MTKKMVLFTEEEVLRNANWGELGECGDFIASYLEISSDNLKKVVAVGTFYQSPSDVGVGAILNVYLECPLEKVFLENYTATEIFQRQWIDWTLFNGEGKIIL